MRLTLNGWPPVASHLACLLLGVSGANLTAKEPPKRLEIAPKTIAVALAPPKGSTDALPPVGSQVYALRQDNGSSGPCRLSAEPFVLLERFPRPVVGGSSALSAVAGALAKDMAAGKITLVEAKAAAARSLCRSSAPKVSYGKS